MAALYVSVQELVKTGEAYFVTVTFLGAAAELKNAKWGQKVCMALLARVLDDVRRRLRRMERKLEGVRVSERGLKGTCRLHVHLVVRGKATAEALGEACRKVKGIGMRRVKKVRDWEEGGGKVRG
ncbi:MAG TPA: hypothetical protein VLZ12_08730, partial [Verrucomicrobiae bacterium]|nr:hypothetical protein [Verrucomicrobiae bacterium]